MPCDCCSTGQCCKDTYPYCSGTSKSECAYKNGEFSASSTPCVGYPCVATETVYIKGKQLQKEVCSVVDECVCSKVRHGTSYKTMQECDCRVLTTSCRAQDCQTCNQDTGVCRDDCPRETGQCCGEGICCPNPRECCHQMVGTWPDITFETTCCEYGQSCNQDNLSGYYQCKDICTPRGSYCPGVSATPPCCEAGKKCCGEQGCLPSTMVSQTVTLTGMQWVNTGLVANNETVHWSISGTVSDGANNWGPSGNPALFPTFVTDGGAGCNAYQVIGKDGSASEWCMGASGQRQGVSGNVSVIIAGTPASGSFRVRVWTGDDPCPDYSPMMLPPAAAAWGPGSAMKKILSLAGIRASENCSCNARAAQMDSWGAWMCVRQMRVICGWLREEAQKRGLRCPWVAGFALVLVAVALAECNRLWKGNSR